MATELDYRHMTSGRIAGTDEEDTADQVEQEAWDDSGPGAEDRARTEDGAGAEDKAGRRTRPGGA